MTITVTKAADARSPNVDWPAWLALAAGLLVMYGPTFLELYQLVWKSDDQSQGPVVLCVSSWLIWRNWPKFYAVESAKSPVLGGVVFALGLLMYIFGRSQTIVQFEAFSLVVLLAGCALMLRGVRGLRVHAFALFFLIFMVPMPGTFVQAVTLPLKIGVSYMASNIMYFLGFPVARSGVLLSVGPYQLLVADACAGLNSMFTLESLGLLYMNLAGHTSRPRNILLALLIIPISFSANVIRVMILMFITFRWGDVAGQGFLHGFAGMVLFLVALSFMLGVDNLLGRIPALKVKAA